MAVLRVCTGVLSLCQGFTLTHWRMACPCLRVRPTPDKPMGAALNPVPQGPVSP